MVVMVVMVGFGLSITARISHLILFQLIQQAASAFLATYCHQLGVLKPIDCQDMELPTFDFNLPGKVDST